MSVISDLLNDRKKRIGAAIILCVIANFVVAFTVLAWRL
jgi:hypothetical protein